MNVRSLSTIFDYRGSAWRSVCGCRIKKIVSTLKMLMKKHTGKVGPRTLRCDPGPRALEQDPKVRPQERILQWDPKVGPQGWTCIYDDPAQPLSIHYQASFSKQNLTPNPVNYNMAMSQARVSVKQLFNKIKTYFNFVSLKSLVRIGRSSHREHKNHSGRKLITDTFMTDIDTFITFKIQMNFRKL